jgi:hypothetical protein
MPKDRLCLECEVKLRGRVDQKFCSDQCRNAYNNALNSDVNSIVRNTNNTLRKNRRILEQLLKGKPEGKTVTTLSNLSKAGFNFDNITSVYTTKSGNVYLFCYEYGYQKLENEKFMIVSRDQ